MTDKSIYDALIEISGKINKAYSLEVAVPGRERSRSDVKEWIPTTSPILNLLLGNEHYGVAVGRIIELFGDYSHGKSTVLQIIMNAWQAAGGVTNLLDSESGWNRDRAVVMGHNPDRHMTVEVDTVEAGFKVINDLHTHYKMKFDGSIPILYGWDTIAASPTEGEKKGDEYESGMMYKARLIRKELKRLAIELPQARSTLIFVNQTIQGPKDRGRIKSTPGGGGIKFWSSQRIQVVKVGTCHAYGDKKKSVGIISSVELVKNKLDPPFRKFDLPINWAEGNDPAREVINYLLDNTNVVNVSGAYKKIVGFGDEDISYYERDTMKVLEDNPGLMEWLIDEAKVHWCGLG